jgi:hypothetical protein
MEEIYLDVPDGGQNHTKAPENTDPSLPCEHNICLATFLSKVF